MKRLQSTMPAPPAGDAKRCHEPCHVCGSPCVLTEPYHSGRPRCATHVHIK